MGVLVPIFPPVVFSKLRAVSSAGLTNFVIFYATMGWIGWVELTKSEPSAELH